MNSRTRALTLGVVLAAASALAHAGPERFLSGWRHFEAGDFFRAFEQWRSAALDGDARAQLNLGLLYETGQGVAPDARLAAHWYASAARQGSAAARANLAQLRAAGAAGPRAGGVGAGRDEAHALEALASLEAIAPAPRDRVSPWDGAAVGSAWPVSRGVVVTNYHVVEGSREVFLVDARGAEIAAEVVLEDRADDIALLRVADADALPPALALAPADAGPGGEVFALGYPRIDVLGHSVKASAGSIGWPGEAGGGRRTYRLDLHVEPGYSGGPVLNARGEVIGAVTGMLGVVDESGTVNVLANAGVAVRLSAIRQILARLPTSRGALAAQRTPAKVDLERLAASVLVVVAR